jgi:hypothetical protein
MKKLIALVAVGVLAACGSSDDDGPAGPRTRLFAATVPPDSVLVELNPATGEFVKTIGTVGYGVNGLEYDAKTRKLYGTTASWDANFPSGLIAIDMATGVGTTVGESGPLNITNLTVNKAGDFYSWSESSDDLVTLSTTGVATVVGGSGIGTAAHGLAFDTKDQLWFYNEDGDVYLMDLVTGVASTMGSTGETAHHGDFHPTRGKYWGIAPAPWANPRRLVEVDFDALTVTTIAPARDDLHVITFAR